MEKDILIHYIVSKKENAKKIKMDVLVQNIYSYVQNNETYFHYEPDFYAGVLLFGIIGFKKGHDKLKKELGAVFDKLDCQVQYIEGNIDDNVGKNNAMIKNIIENFS